MSVLTESEYRELAGDRDKLVELRKKAILSKHIDMIDEQLKTIRQTLKDAHHEKYKRTGQN